MFSKRSSIILGIHQGEGGWKLAFLQKKQKEITILSLQTVPNLQEGLLSVLKTYPPKSKFSLVAGLESDEILRREVKISLQKERDLYQTLPYQLESTFPFPKEETSVLPFPEKEKIVVFATQKKEIESHIKKLKQAPVPLSALSSVPIALLRWQQFVFPEIKNTSLLQNNTFLIIEERKISICHTVEEGMETKMELYQKTKFPHCPSLPSSSPSYNAFSFPTLQEYAIPIGLALDFLYKDGMSHQFLQGAFSPPVVQKEKKKNTLLYLGLLGAFLSFFCITEGLSYKRKEKALHKKLDVYLNSETSHDLSEKIVLWEQKIVQSKKSLSLFPSLYTVSDCLSWLSQEKEAISLLDFSYDVEKYPTVSQKDAPYVVKLTVEFSSTPTVAASFLEKIKKEPFIDPKQPIEWIPLENQYKISFYLKPKL